MLIEAFITIYKNLRTLKLSLNGIVACNHNVKSANHTQHLCFGCFQVNGVIFTIRKKDFKHNTE